MISDDRVEKAVEYLRDHSALIGQLRGQRAYLDHALKVTRSQAFLRHDGTVAEREALAWTDLRVTEMVAEYRDCVTELETLLTRFKAAELLVEVWRTENANARRGNI